MLYDCFQLSYTRLLSHTRYYWRRDRIDALRTRKVALSMQLLVPHFSATVAHRSVSRSRVGVWITGDVASEISFAFPTQRGVSGSISINIPAKAAARQPRYNNLLNRTYPRPPDLQKHYLICVSMHYARKYCHLHPLSLPLLNCAKKQYLTRDTLSTRCHVRLQCDTDSSEQESASLSRPHQSCNC